MIDIDGKCNKDNMKNCDQHVNESYQERDWDDKIREIELGFRSLGEFSFQQVIGVFDWCRAGT